MSAVPIAVRSYEAFASGDMDAVLGDMHPDIEWHQAQGLPHGGLYRGIDEVRRNVFDPLDRDWWAEFIVTPEQFLDAGDDVVVIGRYRGIAKGTGKRLDVPFVHIWTFRGERAVRFRQCGLGGRSLSVALSGSVVLTCHRPGVRFLRRA